jgi:signal transduction histidine kinase/Tfp pilus assembly protein PilF
MLLTKKRVVLCTYILFCLYFTGLYANPKIDSLSAVLVKTKDSETKAQLYMLLSIEYEIDDLDKALEYAIKAVTEARKSKNEMELAEMYNNLANVYEYRSSPDSSFVYHKQALAIRLKNGNKIKIGDSYNNIAIYYDKIGDFPTSLKHYFKALKYYESENNINKKAMVFSNIGIVYKAQEEYEKALSYYQKANDIYTKTEDDFGMAVSQGNIGAVSLMLGKFDNAIKYSENAKKLYQKIKYDRLVVYPINNIATAYDSLKQYSKANELYKESIGLYKKYGNFFEVSNTLSAYAQCLLKQQKTAHAIDLLKEALGFSEISKAHFLEIDIRKNLARAYSKIGDYQQAYKQMEVHDVIRDSLFKQEKIMAVFELEKQYQTERKEREILEQRTIIAEKNLKLGHKNTQVLLTVFLLVISIMLGYTLFYRQKQRSRRIERESHLKAAYQRIETQNQLQKQKLIISRDLHDNIGSQLTFIISSLESIKYYLKEVNPEINQRIDGIAKFTRQTILELRNTIWAMNKEKIDFEDIQARLSDFINTAMFSVRGIDFNLDVEQNIEGDNYKFSSLEGVNLCRVIQEAVNNSIKHSGADKIKVVIKRSADKNHKFNVIIADNGKGFTITEENTGNGIVNMKKRVEEINGRIFFNSDEKGSSIKIII